MEAALRKAISQTILDEMKNPTILMSSKDFEKLENELKEKITNFDAGNNPTFCGIPILKNDFTQNGYFVVFDNTNDDKIGNSNYSLTDFIATKC